MATTCDTTKYVGRAVPLEYQIGCSDTPPVEGSWLSFGSMTTKKLDLKWDDTDVTGDDSVGALRESLATFLSAEVSGDGFCPNRSATTYANFKALTKHFINPTTTGGQPVIWLRLTYPDVTFTFNALLTELSRDSPSDDGVKFTISAKATASSAGITVEDTPAPVVP